MSVNESVEAIVKDMNKEKLDGMSESLIKSVIELVGGSEGFLHEYKAIAEKGAIPAIDHLDDREKVHAFFASNKADLLDYLKKSSWRTLDSSILEVVMKEMYESRIDIDTVAIALFAEKAIGEPLSNADVAVARSVVGMTVTNIARNYNEVVMQKQWVSRQVQRQKEYYSTANN